MRLGIDRSCPPTHDQASEPVRKEYACLLMYLIVTRPANVSARDVNCTRAKHRSVNLVPRTGEFVRYAEEMSSVNPGFSGSVCFERPSLRYQ
jgi:hypothetical protein